MKKEKKQKKCAETGCKRPRDSGDYCRLHYLKNWREVVEERKQKARENLNKYVENLSEQHPDDFMDILKSDIRDDEVFRTKLHDMGFREELEDREKSPFDADNVDELLEELNFDDQEEEKK